MTNSRAKGRRYELAILNRWKEYGYSAVRNDQCQQDHGASDLDVTGDYLALHIECKNVQSLPGKRVLDAYEQAVNGSQSGAVPIVYFHRHGTSEDYCFLRSSDFEALCISSDKHRRAGDVSDDGSGE